MKNNLMRTKDIKRCTKCKEWKKFGCFYKEKRTKIGLQSGCKECLLKIGREYWYNNHEKNLLRKKKYRIKNREILRKKSQERYYENIIENRKKNCKNQKNYYKKNSEKIKERARLYSKANRKKILKAEQKWARENPIKYKEKNKKNNLRRKNLIKTNPKIRLSTRISNLIRLRLKARLSNKNKKHKKDYLPYTIDELMCHLEKQFKPGMTWNNYGKWHIDHIRPDCSFNYISVEDMEFQECWSLKNLQPLWAKENKSKGGRL